LTQRFNLIAPVVTRELPRGVKTALIRDLASTLHVGENQELITVGQRTLERYVACYRQGGLEALKPQVRPEKNSLKTFSQETLRLQILECIRQRITVQYKLPTLGEEVSPYIFHHLRVAGLDRQIFIDEAIQFIYQFSKGILRRINNICRYAIIAAIEADSPAIDADIVRKSMEDEPI
jgi:hypothetical protein